jgi:hypothetical protein
MGVPGGRLHFEDAVAYVENRHVEGSTTEVEDEDCLVFAFVIQAVGKCRRRGLIDDTEHLEPGNLAGLFRCRSLRVIEVGGDSDDRLGDRVTKKCFGIFCKIRAEISWAE